MIIGRELEVAIQPGVASAAQQAAMDRIVLYGASQYLPVIVRFTYVR